MRILFVKGRRQAAFLAMVGCFGFCFGQEVPRDDRERGENAALLYYQAMISGPGREWLSGEVQPNLASPDLGRDAIRFLDSYKGVFTLLYDAADIQRCEWNSSALARPGNDWILTAPLLSSYKSLTIGAFYQVYWHAALGEPQAAAKAARAATKLLDRHPLFDYSPLSPLLRQLDDVAFLYLPESLKGLSADGRRHLFKSLESSRRMQVKRPEAPYWDYSRAAERLTEEIADVDEEAVSDGELDRIAAQLVLARDWLRDDAYRSRDRVVAALWENRRLAREILDRFQLEDALEIRRSLLDLAERHPTHQLPVSLDLQPREVLSLFEAHLAGRVRWHMMYVALGMEAQGWAFAGQHPCRLSGRPYEFLQSEDGRLLIRSTAEAPLEGVEIALSGLGALAEDASLDR